MQSIPRNPHRHCDHVEIKLMFERRPEKVDSGALQRCKCAKYCRHTLSSSGMSWILVICNHSTMTFRRRLNPFNIQEKFWRTMKSWCLARGFIAPLGLNASSNLHVNEDACKNPPMAVFCISIPGEMPRCSMSWASDPSAAGSDRLLNRASRGLLFCKDSSERSMSFERENRETLVPRSWSSGECRTNLTCKRAEKRRQHSLRAGDEPA